MSSLPQTVSSLLTSLAADGGENDCLVDSRRRLNYQEFSDEVDFAARALLASGIGHGDRVGILAGNRSEWLVVYFASMSIGAIAVGLNTWSTASELDYQLGHAAVKMLFFERRFRDRDFFELINEVRAGNHDLTHLADPVEFECSEPGVSGRTYAEWLSCGKAISPAALSRARNRVTGDDVGCLLYTSGSTALPKGVPLIQRDLIENMWEIGERQKLSRNDRLWLSVSLFWSLACVNAVFAVITHGGSITLQHHFDAGEAISLIEQERLTVFYGTPNMALALAEHPKLKTADLSSLRTGVTIGTPAQVRRVADLGVERICNVYGLTESYGNSSVTDADLPLNKRLESVGQPLAGVEIAIVDPEDRRHLDAEVQGEIAIRGRVTPGYWNDPERTAEAFTDDGWFLTGDLGILDSAGFLYFRGRLKEMVKTGGINVAPAEVEAVLTSHESVELAFVTGIADPKLDEALAAVIVLKPGRHVDSQALSECCREALAAYKTPRHYRFVTADELPLTTTGKLQRNRLAELFT